jgi:hypothetical protein
MMIFVLKIIGCAFISVLITLGCYALSRIYEKKREEKKKQNSPYHI